MSGSSKKLLHAAAGTLAASGDPLYVDDVFSTSLYTGNATSRAIENGIALGDLSYGASVEFDGTSDTLTRASDFSSNADGKTFTFSAWIFALAGGTIYHSGGSNFTDGITIHFEASGELNIKMDNPSGSTVFSVEHSGAIPLNKWTHLLISCDMASTSNRYIYVDDAALSISYLTYTDSDIDFTSSAHSISSLNKIKGRLTHIYLDYTYRDLSTTSNRRLFTTADGQPAANQAGLNPIMFMPLDDTNAIGKNLGTGGDFTANGSPTALSQGGPYIEVGHGKGGLVWIKNREVALGHTLSDTERGANKQIYSHTTGAEGSQTTIVTAFNANGFTVGTDSDVNQDTKNIASWTFREAEKFFDIVTYTGGGSAGRTIAHNLGSTPGMIIVKKTSGSGLWATLHKDANLMYLERTNAQYSAGSTATMFGDGTNVVRPTDSVFTVGAADNVNTDGQTYVAYLFASDAGGFGDDGTENIIKCGTFTTDGDATPADIDLGFEPQFFMYKPINIAGNWFMNDIMRGLPVANTSGESGDVYLYANLAAAEGSPNTWGAMPTSSGITWRAEGLTDDDTYAYMAIRRPMKPPTAGTEVFLSSFGDAGADIDVGFPLDLLILGTTDSTGSANTHVFVDRLRGSKKYLQTNTMSVEQSANGEFTLDEGNNFTQDQLGGTKINWFFKRAPGFLDVVTFTGTATVRTIAHNLGVKPDLMFFKNRKTNNIYWVVYNSASGAEKYLFLHQDSAIGDSIDHFNDTEPTASVFTVGDGNYANRNNDETIAYLFGSLDGVSKIGSIVHSGTTDVACGFEGGARFVIAKRLDDSGGWYVWDTTRGIIAGNDPYVLFDTTDAEVTNTDYIDPLTGGFTFSDNFTDGTYLYFAIA
tara:strand:- start:382 stop:2997 length:2616 start_codon:yes stop_codon:yes gene_type:complete